MFIDFLTLLLLNMTAGLAIAAVYFLRGIVSADARPYAPAFLVVGLVATIFGGAIVTHWPVPKPWLWANMAFGEMSVLLGMVFLGAAVATAMGWRLTLLGVYAALAGIAAVVLGVGFLPGAATEKGLTAAPMMSAAAFMLTGLAGVLALPTLLWPRKPLRILTSVVLLSAVVLWAATTYMSYWAHLVRYAQ
jgi:putative membrane protein